MIVRCPVNKVEKVRAKATIAYPNNDAVDEKNNGVDQEPCDKDWRDKQTPGRVQNKCLVSKRIDVGVMHSLLDESAIYRGKCDLCTYEH